MDLYSKISLSGSDIISDKECDRLEDVLENQLEQSDFAEQAADTLGDMITQTDDFKNNVSVQSMSIKDRKGKKLSKRQLRKMNVGKSLELSDDIKLTVEVINKGSQLHFNNGIQLAVGVEAEFEADVDEGTIKIDLSATFVEECELVPRIKGSIVTKEILFIPIPIGVSVNTTMDVKNFTAFSFTANIYTVKDDDKSVWEKVKDIANDPAEAVGLSNLPDGLKSGLKSVKDVMDKIEETQAKVDQANETADQIKGYKEDLDALWKVMEENGTDREQWNEMCKTLGKTTWQVTF